MIRLLGDCELWVDAPFAASSRVHARTVNSLPASVAITAEVFDCAKTTKDVLTFVLSNVHFLHSDGSTCARNSVGASAACVRPMRAPATAVAAIIGHQSDDIASLDFGVLRRDAGATEARKEPHQGRAFRKTVVS